MEKIPRSTADEFCQKLKPQEKPIYIRDSQVKGLVLRVMPTGSKSWIFCYSIKEGDKWRERRNVSKDCKFSSFFNIMLFPVVSKFIARFLTHHALLNPFFTASMFLPGLVLALHAVLSRSERLSIG